MLTDSAPMHVSSHRSMYEGMTRCAEEGHPDRAWAYQLVDQAHSAGVSTPVRLARSMPSAAELAAGAVFVANYELADRFGAMSEFIGVVLDESSILKHKECKTGMFLVESCKAVPYKLALSATPCPNDFSELPLSTSLLVPSSRHPTPREPGVEASLMSLPVLELPAQSRSATRCPFQTLCEPGMYLALSFTPSLSV